LKSGWQPLVLGIVLGLVLFLPIFICGWWFPWVLDRSYDWAQTMYVSVIVACGVLIARYWNFLHSSRLWLSLMAIALQNLAGAFIFSEYLRRLNHWNIGLIVALGVSPWVPFLDWFLEKRSKRQSHRSAPGL